MAKVGAVEAARLAGVSRWTIARKFKAGVLSFELGSDGERLVDTAELTRVFGVLHPDAPELHPVHAPGLHHGAPSAPGAGAPAGASAGEAAALREALARIERENERLRADLEAERQERRQAEREHREERQRLQEQIGRALLLLPAPSSATAGPTYVPLTEAGEREVRRHLAAAKGNKITPSKKARRRTRKPQEPRTPTGATDRTRTTARPPERPQAPAAPTTLAGRVLEAVNVLVGATPPGRGFRPS